MIDTVTCFTMMMWQELSTGIPLKVIVLESGVGWVQWWTEKMDQPARRETQPDRHSNCCRANTSNVRCGSGDPD